jgi:hypothetical protein
MEVSQKPMKNAFFVDQLPMEVLVFPVVVVNCVDY